MEGSAPQAGFYYQNNIAALKILESLFFKSDIYEIRLDNYKKGKHIDDVIVYRNNFTEYYQVKWAADEETVYSLHGMLNSRNKADGKVEKKSLFRQLAEGFQDAQKNGGKFSITLFTVKQAGNKKLPSKGLDHGLRDLIDNFFEPVKKSAERYDRFTAFSEYGTSVEKVRQECGLCEDEFDAFLRCLVFQFNQLPKDDIQRGIKQRMDTLGIDLSFFERLLDAVVNWSISGEEITKEKVLVQLGIANRFEDKLSHYFNAVEDGYYVLNSGLNEKLNRALSELNGGYIFIEGLPGIGKSTALTKFREKHLDVTLAYYCFLPDERNGFGDLRYQKEYFFKSLCIGIERNFPQVDFPAVYSEDFPKKFLGYIEKLGELDGKIIFIIDGLDHVDRDSTLGDNSMLTAISGSLPENVFFILSSQYISVLSPSVKRSVQSDDRRYIKVEPFGQREIREYLDNKEIYSAEILDEVERVSGGIPVYLYYITEQLLAVDSQEYEEVLKGLPKLVDGQINVYHEYLYSKVEESSFSKWVLAVLAYRKEHTSVETIHEILKIAGEQRSRTEVEDMVRSFSHLLKQIDGRSFAIFHNSFREFIISKTADLRPIFNKALISYYQQNQFTDDGYRNYFDHLFQEGHFDEVMELTTWDWVQKAWKNYRSLDEIANNIDIALQSAVEKGALAEFIRISYLKDQVNESREMFRNSNIDLSIVLLNAGESSNSLRLVWDGDFVLTNKEYFCYYVNEYFRKTGNLPQHNFLKRGLLKPLTEKVISSLTKELKLKALLPGNVGVLFDEIDLKKWSQANDKPRDLSIRRHHSEEENKNINRGIKYEMIDHLLEFKQYKKLDDLLAATDDEKICLRTSMALIKYFLSVDEKAAAVDIAKRLDYRDVEESEYTDFIVFCCDYLSNEEIRRLFRAPQIERPNLPKEIISKEGISFRLCEDVLGLFRKLKVLYIFQRELVQNAKSESHYFDSPATEIYESIFLLAKLWDYSRTACGEIGGAEKATDLFKAVITELYVEREPENNRRHHGLFDMNFDNSFISYDIYRLFKDIFHLAKKLLTQDRLKNLVEYWIELDNSGDGFRHYTVALTIAKEVSGAKPAVDRDLLHSVISHAEQTVRSENETYSLTTYLSEVAETYGLCGFKEDFKRLYGQLLETSFGLGNRKDYRAANIVEPMKMMHKLDPQNTLVRLAEVLEIQNVLGGAGDFTMRNVALKHFISFSADVDPALAFRLLELEEPYIERDETLHQILKRSMPQCKKEELELYLALIKTLPRWENGEGYFIPLLTVLLERAFSLNDMLIAGEVWALMEYHTSVEFDDPKGLVKVRDILVQKGFDISGLTTAQQGAEASAKTTGRLEEDRQSNKKIKFKFRQATLEFDALSQLFRQDFDTFSSYIRQQISTLTEDSRNQLLREQYHFLKKSFLEFLDSSSFDPRAVRPAAIHGMIRSYILLKNNLVVLDRRTALKDVRDLFERFFEEIKVHLDNADLSSYFSENMDLDSLAENLLSQAQGLVDFDFAHVLDMDEIFRLVEICAPRQLGGLADYIEEGTTGKIRSGALIRIIRRLLHLDFDEAKRILRMLDKFEYESILFPRDGEYEATDFDILESLFEKDAVFARKFLLHNYFQQKRKYSRDLTRSVDKLLKYRAYYEESVEQSYYSANLAYNMGLSRGLPERESRYGFIAEHVGNLSLEDIVIRHLIWLFNYPVVKIREATMQSCFDLLHKDSSRLNKFIDYLVLHGKDNQLEHGIVVLQGIALKNPGILFGFKDVFIDLLKRGHFNIVESTAELLNILRYSNQMLLSDEDLATMYSFSGGEHRSSDFEGKRRIYPFNDFQKSLCYEISGYDKSKVSIFDEIGEDMLLAGWENYGEEQQAEIHRRYNKNTNFDTIEIQTPYDDEFKSCMNRNFHSKISQGYLDAKSVEYLKNKFRIFDPGKLLYQLVKKPSFVDWFPAGIGERDFKKFTDFDGLMEAFLNRSVDYVTLFERGSQRCGGYQKTSGTCYFEVTPFVAEAGTEIHNFVKLPLYKVFNQYGHELSTADSSKGGNTVRPLLQYSENDFRGEEVLGDANLFPYVYKSLNINEKTGLDLYLADEMDTIKSLKWISTYDNAASWRWFKPSGEGILLEIQKSVLLEFLKKNRLKLFLHVQLKRSTNNNRTEDFMHWNYFRKNVEFTTDEEM